MMTSSGLISLLVLFLGTGDDPKASGRTSPVVIYGNVSTEIETARSVGDDLWVTIADLARATKMELKPEGVCTDKTCTPLPAARKTEFVREESGTKWFNLTEFARLLKQPVAHDAKHQVWFFGPRPEEQNGYLANLTAPDFTLPDMNGKMHSLSDFRGKKVLLITWGSW